MKRVRFYDDNQKYLRLEDPLRDVVETVWVRPEPMMNPSNPRKFLKDEGEYVRFLKSEAAGWDLHGSDSDLMELLTKIGNNTTEVALGRGLNERHTSDLRRFALNLPDEPRGTSRGVVIFDWDEVLNCAEGFRAIETIQPTAHLKFAMGTRRRLDDIRACIDFLVNNHVAVHIATNNTACKKPLYKSIVRELHPAIQVHCCGMNGHRTKSACIRLEHMIPPHLMTPVRRSASSLRTYANRVSS